MRKKRPPPDLAASFMVRDPTPAQLQDLLESLRPGQPLPPDRYQQIISLIGWALVQVQDYQRWSDARVRHQRWAAVRDAIKRGKPLKEAFTDAVERLAGTPAAGGWEMMKKAYYAEQKVRRRPG